MEPGSQTWHLERSIRRRFRRHIRELGFQRKGRGQIDPSDGGKDQLRALHSKARSERLRQEKRFVIESFPELKRYFAEGTEVSPAAIKARLQLVEADTEESDLFRLATLTWGVPVTPGYGRRMRFLVWDSSNGKLMGLVGLSDPVFNLQARDAAIGWSGLDRVERLVDVMNAHVLGAVPPYNMLLGGKLVACLVRSREIRDEFRKKYRTSKGVISRKEKNPSLVLVTTSSSLGKSAVYDRLRLGGTTYFESVGFTSGWGHFHISGDLFDDIRKYLRMRHHSYAGGNEFGDGSNWRLRTMRAALELAGMDANLMRHNVRREVFLCRLASNSDRVLRGEVSRPFYHGLLSVDEVSRLAVDRWVVKRAKSRTEYLRWGLDSLLSLLKPNGNGLASLPRVGYQAPLPVPGVRPVSTPRAGLVSTSCTGNRAI